MTRAAAPGARQRIARGFGALALAGLASMVVPAPAMAGPAMAGPAAGCAARPHSDPLTAVPWPLQRLRPELAWPLSRGKGVIVAVIDSGVSTQHPKLAGQVLGGTDFVNPGGDGTCDGDGHGTLVASLIVGKDSADSPFHGIAPDARVLPVKVLPDSRANPDPAISQRVADAITWAAGHGARVINLSLYTTDSPALQAAVKAAAGNDVVIVAAAGNTGSQAGAARTYPAAYPEVLAVGGVDQAGAHVQTSTVGSYVRVAAPGLAVEGAAAQGGGYVVDTNGGTSFSAPYVAGVAALIRSEFPTLRAAEVVHRIIATADAPPDGRDDQVGYGVVNPYRAVSTVLARDDTVIPTPHAQLAATGRTDNDAARLRGIALGTGFAGVLIAVILLVVVPLIRRTNERTAAIEGPAPAGAATPTLGRRPEPQRSRHRA